MPELTINVPEQTIQRLPLYLRELERLKRRGRETITSHQFVEHLPGINSDNLRKDLSYFGNYGTQGQGYDISHLAEQLRKVLKLQASKQVALIGVGNLGKALLNYEEFSRWGFEICLAFDKDPEVVGKEFNGVAVESARSLKDELKEQGIEVAMVAVPEGEAQSVANVLVSAGVKGILNFSPTLLEVPEEVRVTQVDITSKLSELSFYL